MEDLGSTVPPQGIYAVLDALDRMPKPRNADEEREFAARREQFFTAIYPLGQSQYNCSSKKNELLIDCLEWLYVALRQGNDQYVEEFCQVYKDSADLWLQGRSNGWNWLHFAAAKCSGRAIRALVNAGVDINETTHLGESPLYIAVTHYNMNAFDVLIELGCIDSVEPINHLNAATLIERKINYHQRRIEAAEKSSLIDADVSENESHEKVAQDTPGYHANKMTLLRAMQHQLQHQYDNQYLPLQLCLGLPVNSQLDTMLHRVCQSLDIETLNNWIKYDRQDMIRVDFNKRNRDGVTPLMYAVVAEFYLFLYNKNDQIERGISTFITKLVNAGANINSLDCKGFDALDYALVEGCYLSLQVLFVCGADPIANRTFRKAFYQQRGIETLISAMQVYIQFTDPTPFNIGKIIHFLIGVLQDPSAENNDTQETQFLTYCIEYLVDQSKLKYRLNSNGPRINAGQLIEWVNDKNETPLFTAVHSQKCSFILYFIERHANLLHQNDRKQWVWDIAAETDNPEVIALIAKAKANLFETLETTKGLLDYFHSHGCTQYLVDSLYQLEIIDENMDQKIRDVFNANNIIPKERPSNITYSFIANIGSSHDNSSSESDDEEDDDEEQEDLDMAFR